ncbi:hypothetical protein ACFS2C_15790 [Prauserella oleivorans]|uniref:Uncharacterized protein n=1 Tax=Prauserella oleivorans TaxID=1478153 RepID=A0ABW5WBK7_9PSEU
MTTAQRYPVRASARLDPELSRRLWAGRAERDAGFLSRFDDVSTGTCALSARPVERAGTPADLALLTRILGEVRVRLETRGGEVFVGIARDEAATRDLRNGGADGCGWSRRPIPNRPQW